MYIYIYILPLPKCLSIEVASSLHSLGLGERRDAHRTITRGDGGMQHAYTGGPTMIMGS